MSFKGAIKVEGLTKVYRLYDSPRDRFKQFFGINVTDSVRDIYAIKNISFEIGKGEVVGIVGRNGSGKSTLLQILCGVLKPTAGTITVNGRLAALLELGSGFNLDFTGRENIGINAAILGLNGQELNKCFEDIVSFADIGEFLDAPAKTYSSGMLMRLAFSVAIHTNPKILVIDEALAVGDELFQRKCFAKINAIKESGATILLVSHSANSIIQFCDSAKLIDAGELIYEGPAKPVVAAYHKILYGSEQSQADARLDLAATAIVSNENSSTLSGDEEKKGSVEIVALEDELFLPELISESSFDYEVRGAKIVNPKLQTINGKIINQLFTGRRYSYSYNVKFSKNVKNVRFSMLIKNISGYELSGNVTGIRPQELISEIAAGQEYCIKFEFTCTFNPGLYFLNAGVLGVAENEEIYLHRKIDALAFKVLYPGADVHLDTCVVNSDIKSEYYLNG